MKDLFLPEDYEILKHFITNVVIALTSKLKIGYIVLSAIAIILASHLLLSDSNLPYFIALLFIGLAVLVTIAVWYGIVRPLSKDMD